MDVEHTLPATGLDNSVAIRPLSYAWFVVFVLLIFPLHESAHYVTYRLLGIEVPMTLNTASPVDRSLRSPVAELAGPLMNLIVATASAAAYLRLKRRREWLAQLALASAMMRLVVYVLVVGAAVVTGSGLSRGNDEPIAANLWGLPSLALVAVFTLPCVSIVASVVQTFEGNWMRRGLHLLGFGFIVLCIGLLVGNVLDPWLFPNR